MRNPLRFITGSLAAGALCAVLAPGPLADDVTPGPEDGFFKRLIRDHGYHMLTVFLVEEADYLYEKKSGPRDEALLGPSGPFVPDDENHPRGPILEHKTPILGALAVGGMVAANGRDYGRYVDDVMGLIEADKFNWATSSLVKNVVGRRRPHSDSRDSFYSDAASTAFTWTAYTDSVLARGFQGHPQARWWSAAGLYGLAGYIARSRVVEGKHYVTDVLAGAAAGFTVGKMFYRVNHRPDEDAAEDDRRVSFSPVVVPGGAGINVSIRF